jgi:hypothetical protein
MMWNGGRGRERIFDVMVVEECFEVIVVAEVKVEVEGSEIYFVVRALADFDLFLPT